MDLKHNSRSVTWQKNFSFLALREKKKVHILIYTLVCIFSEVYESLLGYIAHGQLQNRNAKIIMRTKNLRETEQVAFRFRITRSNEYSIDFYYHCLPSNLRELSR